MSSDLKEDISRSKNQPLISENEAKVEESCQENGESEAKLENHNGSPKLKLENKISSNCSASKDEKIPVTTSLCSGGEPSKLERANANSMAKSQSEIQVSVSNSLSVSQTSKNSLMTFSSSGTFYDHNTVKKKVDLRITPKRVVHSNGRDATDFRQMEQGLLQLLEDFHSGKLEAFGQDCTFEKMENVRERQERLARLHFDLNAQQELCGQHTEEGIKMANTNLSKLMENLQQLSLSIEQLQSGSPAVQTDP